MQFNSLLFVCFFALVLIMHRALGGVASWRTRKCVLIVASYVFYAAWNPPFVVLLWLSTVVDWFIGSSALQFALSVIVLFVANTLPGFLAAMGVALALFLSPVLPRPSPRSHRTWAFAFGVIALTGLVLSWPPELSDPSTAWWLLFSLSMLAAVGLLPATEPESVGDADGEPLDGGRLRCRCDRVIRLAVRHLYRDRRVVEQHVLDRYEIDTEMLADQQPALPGAVHEQVAINALA